MVDIHKNRPRLAKMAQTFTAAEYIILVRCNAVNLASNMVLGCTHNC